MRATVNSRLKALFLACVLGMVPGIPVALSECSTGCHDVIEGQSANGSYYEFFFERTTIINHTNPPNEKIPVDPQANAYKKGEGKSVCEIHDNTPGEATVTPTDPNWTFVNMPGLCNDPPSG